MPNLYCWIDMFPHNHTFLNIMLHSKTSMTWADTDTNSVDITILTYSYYSCRMFQWSYYSTVLTLLFLVKAPALTEPLLEYIQSGTRSFCSPLRHVWQIAGNRLAMFPLAVKLVSFSGCLEHTAHWVVAQPMWTGPNKREAWKRFEGQDRDIKEAFQ